MAKKIKDVALAIWNEGNKSWDEFTVFLYLPEMNTNSMAYGIANFTPSGLENFNVQEFAFIMGYKMATKVNRNGTLTLTPPDIRFKKTEFSLASAGEFRR